MSDLISGITEILDDPTAAAKIGEIAKSLSSTSDTEATAPTAKETSAFSGLDIAVPDRHINLLKAIQPYMRDGRSEKIGVAIKAITMLKTLTKLK